MSAAALTPFPWNCVVLVMEKVIVLPPESGCTVMLVLLTAVAVPLIGGAQVDTLPIEIGCCPPEQEVGPEGLAPPLSLERLR